MKRHRSSMAAATMVLGATLAACGGGAQWRYYAPFRIAGPERFVAPPEPGEVHFAGVASRLHYIALTLDGVFFRNLPKTLNRQVALGVTVSGAVDGKDIQIVSEPVEARGGSGFLYFERPIAIDPFLYTGRPLRVTLSLRDIGPSEAINLRGRLQGLGFSGLAAKILPGATVVLDQHARQFEAFMGKAHKGSLYSYTFSLYPSDMDGVRADLVVTGGRHVFVAIPSAGAPKDVRPLKPDDIAYKVRLTGRRLEWRHNAAEYQESPYILLSIIRYKRYPSDASPIAKANARLERFMNEGNFTLARGALGDVGQAILAASAITQTEKNFETAWRDVREARIDAAEAVKAGDKTKAQKATEREVRRLQEIGRDFQQILEPADVKDIQFQARRAARKNEELAAELGRPANEVLAMKEKAREVIAAIKVPPSPPSSPSLAQKAPALVTVAVEVPTPFYKTWWFYTTVGAALAAIGGGVTGYVLAKDPVKPGPWVSFGKPSGQR